MAPILVKIWTLTYEPSNRLTDIQEIWYFLNLNDYVQECLMQNFSVLALILTDIVNFLLEKGMEGVKKKGRKGVSK